MLYMKKLATYLYSYSEGDNMLRKCWVWCCGMNTRLVCTEGCLCDHLAVVRVGKFMIYLSVTILTWVSIVMKLKWM